MQIHYSTFSRTVKGGGDITKIKSEFGIESKVRLIQMGKTQKWLADEVTRRTGLYVDSGYLHKIFCGERCPPRIVECICDVLGIDKPA